MAGIIIHDFLLGFIKILILHYADKNGQIYGKEFHEDLVNNGYEVSYGTIYPLFHKFEEKGYLACEGINVKGKIRKYYSITDSGRIALEESKLKAKDLFMVLFEK